MNAPDVLQIVDVYPYFHERGRQTMKKNPDDEAQNFSMLVRPFGRHGQKIAILAGDDEQRYLAYRRAGYETISMNDRDSDLTEFILRMETQIKELPPKHLVLVSDDPDFVHLCNAVESNTQLAVWANSATAPKVLKNPKYGWHPLEELLPDLKVPRIDVRVDFENIFIGLVKERNWRPNVRELVEGIRMSMQDLGEVVTVTAYGDFDELARCHPGVNFQRELTLANAESRYVINQHGKNTADMKIADDIRTLVEHDQGSGGAVDIIGLATMDRDFRHIVETAQRRGKKVVVLGLKGRLSRELEGVASETRYLDDHLKMNQSVRLVGKNEVPPASEDVAFMMRVAAWMHHNRWRHVYRDRLEQEFGGEAERLNRLIADTWLVPTTNSPLDGQGQARALEPNPEKPTAIAAHLLARWIPERIAFCLNKRGMPHVDSNYLATGMARDTTLAELGIAQTRDAADNWLRAAMSAGLVVSTNQPHPQTPTKLITTWRLPEEVATPSVGEPAEVVPIVPVASSHLRQLLTHGLSEGDLTRVLFDYFLEVHRNVDGAPKSSRIQALLDFVDTRGKQAELLAAIHEVNPALAEEPETLAKAA